MIGIEELFKYQDMFLSCVKRLSLSADEQIAQLEPAYVADELALDYCESAVPCANVLYDNDWLTDEDLQRIEEIEELFFIMSDNKSLWNNEALASSKEWDKCRALSIELLNTINIIEKFPV